MRYEDMEYENCENVLRYIISDSGNPTRAEIAKRLGLSKATVTQIINRFIAYGLVHEGQRLARQGKGRPGNPLSVNKDMEMELSGDMLHKVRYKDSELVGTVRDICRESFSKNGPADLRLEDRYRLADILRRRYGLGIKQLARLTGTKPALLKIVLK